MMKIETQLSQLQLHGMNSSWQALLETKRHHELTLTEGLDVLLQAELQNRENKRFERLRKNAHFRYQASVEELYMDTSRGLDKEMISTLAMGEYISKGESILITGATGCGKSFIASALGHQACAQGYKVVYFNLQKLLLKTKMARVEGVIYKFLEKISKANLLILDEIFDSSLDATGTDEFQKILNTLGNENVFVISHKQDVLADKFRSTIRFNKERNFSHVVE